MRQLLVLALVIVVIVVAVVFLMNMRGSRWGDDGVVDRDPVGTQGIDRDRAREVGAEIAEGVASGLSAAERAVVNGRITAKIKSKMALDDIIRARTIDVDTEDGVVTLTGTVASEGERERALRLAKETDDVRSVVDQLRVR